jgi:hypothetical protein
MPIAENFYKHAADALWTFRRRRIKTAQKFSSFEGVLQQQRGGAIRLE